MKAKFDYDLDFETLDFRQHPEKYRIGVGEQGVLLVEPYKSEILPHWRFRTPEVATESSDKIYQLFLDYKAAGDFVGMDMARKFLQMGITRARRYANHKGGRKYKNAAARQRREALPKAEEDPVKAESARIFREKYLLVKEDEDYIRLAQEHREKYERDAMPPTNKKLQEIKQENLKSKKKQPGRSKVAQKHKEAMS